KGLTLAITRTRTIHDIPAVALPGTQWPVSVVEDQAIDGTYVVAAFVAKITEDVVLHCDDWFIRCGQPSPEFGREYGIVAVALVDPSIDDDRWFTFLIGLNIAPRRYSICRPTHRVGVNGELVCE